MADLRPGDVVELPRGNKIPQDAADNMVRDGLIFSHKNLEAMGYKIVPNPRSARAEALADLFPSGVTVRRALADMFRRFQVDRLPVPRLSIPLSIARRFHEEVVRDGIFPGPVPDDEAILEGFMFQGHDINVHAD